MSAITAGTPFSTREMAAAKAHMVALSLMSGTYVFGTCISLHTRLIYPAVLFSFSGAHRLMKSAIVLQPYLLW